MTNRKIISAWKDKGKDMKIIVGVKRVVDHNVKVRVRTDGMGIDLANVRMSMNPFDEIALEEAVRLREKNKVSEIIAVSIGNPDAKETLRSALAMGADRALFVLGDITLESLSIALILKEIVLEEAANLVLLGKQAIDDDNNQTGQMLAGLLGWSQATSASSLVVEKQRVIVSCEVDNGMQTIAVSLPTVITADLRLNEPRYISLPNIIKARKKSIEEKTLVDLNLQYKSHLKILAVEEPEPRAAGTMVKSAAELIEKLHFEKKVI